MNKFHLVVLLVFLVPSNGKNGSNADEDIPFTSDMPNEKIPVFFDTDDNNKPGDQHALAYLLINEERLDIKGITSGGSDVQHL